MYVYSEVNPIGIHEAYSQMSMGRTAATAQRKSAPLDLLPQGDGRRISVVEVVGSGHAVLALSSPAHENSSKSALNGVFSSPAMCCILTYK